jgi:hypothetical protein
MGENTVVCVLVESWEPDVFPDNMRAGRGQE